jgi:hypothetical protein
MPEILFVHGTGVRLGSYDQSLSLVRRQVERFLDNTKVHQCLWGNPIGAKLLAGGASIPTYGDMPGQKPTESETELLEQATWRMLGEDALFEIRLLENLPPPKSKLAPNAKPAGEVSLDLLRTLQPPVEFIEIVNEKGLKEFWDSSYKSLLKQPELARILRSANREPMEISRALARSLVASMLAAASVKEYPQISAATRTQLINLLIPELGGQPKAVFDWVKKSLIEVAKSYATNKARRERHALSDAAYPAAGDVVLYQARGQAIRDFIHKRILEIDNELIVIAHSLGGIATVDLLIERDISDLVKGLVTVGSQAPFLYEINALTSLPYGNSLPSHFPKKWLNIWDPNDFLSYVGAGVFGDSAVKDFMVKSDLSFPDSHSAYWEQYAIWTEIQAFFS